MKKCLALVCGLLAAAIGVYAQPPAAAVYGQADFTSSQANRGGPASAETLNYPLGLLVDGAGGLYVADRNNHRVLYFAPDGDTVADHVYGQHGDLTAHIVNNDGSGNSGGASANNLAMPTGIVLDSAGGLFVADRDNRRVLYFAPDGDTTADRVYGQYGNFNTNMINNDGSGNYGEPGRENFSAFILGITIDSQDGLYVSDSASHRILYFANDGDTVADRVYGQWDTFTSGVRNNDGDGRIGPANARSLNFPRGLAVDASDGLYVADRDNNRILYFANDGDTVADRVFGQYDNLDSNVPANDGSGASGAPSVQNLIQPKAVVVDASSGIWIADSLQHRILYFANDGDTVADRVFGQAGSFTTGAVNANGGPGPETFSLPQGLALDAAGQLYVSDTGNNRVLVIPGG